MAAFKQINKQDVFVTGYIAKKLWDSNIDGSEIIQVYRGVSGSLDNLPYVHDLFRGQSETLLYSGIKHLFYEGSLGDGTYTGSRDWSLQTTVTQSGSRVLGTEIAVISIPRSVYGIGIDPGSFKVQSELESSLYVWDEYVEEGYVAYSGATILVDDTKGNVVVEDTGVKVGDIIYNQGIAVITSEEEARYFSSYSVNKFLWASRQPVLTQTVVCRVKDSEFNFSQNRTVQTGSFGDIKEHLVDVNPYVTTVGLYNEAQELVAVAKLNKPIPKPGNTDITFIIKFDL